MNNFDSKKFKAIMDAIKYAIKCPSCGGSFVDNDIEMITGDKKAYFVKLACSACGLNVVASLVNVRAMKDSNYLEDLNLIFEDDLSRNSQRKIISSNDVIDVHYFLQRFEGRLK